MLALGLALTALLVPGSAAAQAPVDGVGFPQRLTQIGPDGNTAFGAFDPGVAYNTLQDEFLVVWQGIDPSAPTETEIYGRLLDGVGAPKGPVHRLSEVPGTNPAGQPVVGYSPVVNQYLLAYTGFPPAAVPPPANNPAGQVEILGQVVTSNGVRSGNPVRISNTDPTNADADQATDPAMAYDPERDQFRIVWRADETEADFEIFTRRVSSSLIDPGGFTVIPISTTAAGTADDPVIAHLPDQDRYAIAWESNVAGASFISREVISVGAGTIADDAADLRRAQLCRASLHHRKPGRRRVPRGIRQRRGRRGFRGVRAAALVRGRPESRMRRTAGSAPWARPAPPPTT